MDWRHPHCPLISLSVSLSLFHSLSLQRRENKESLSKSEAVQPPPQHLRVMPLDLEVAFFADDAVFGDELLELLLQLIHASCNTAKDCQTAATLFHVAVDRKIERFCARNIKRILSTPLWRWDDKPRRFDEVLLRTTDRKPKSECAEFSIHVHLECFERFVVQSDIFLLFRKNCEEPSCVAKGRRRPGKRERRRGERERAERERMREGKCLLRV